MIRISLAVTLFCLHCAHAPYLAPLATTPSSGRLFILTGSENRTVKGTLESGPNSSSLSPTGNAIMGNTSARGVASPDGVNLFTVGDADAACGANCTPNVTYSNNQGASFRYMTTTELAAFNTGSQKDLTGIDFVTSATAFLGIATGDANGGVGAGENHGIFTITGSPASPVFTRVVGDASVGDCPANGPINAQTVKIISQNLYYVGRTINRATYRSTDGGATWLCDRLTGAGFAESIKEFAFFPPDNLWVVGGTTATAYFIYKKTDMSSVGPSSWQQQCDSNVTAPKGACAGGGNAALNSISFINALEGFAVGSSGLYYKTIDGGTTWEKVSIVVDGVAITRTFSKIRMNAQGFGVLMAISSGQVFVTSDKGTTWKDSGATTFSMNGIYLKE